MVQMIARTGGNSEKGSLSSLISSGNSKNSTTIYQKQVRNKLIIRILITVVIAFTIAILIALVIAGTNNSTNAVEPTCSGYIGTKYQFIGSNRTIQLLNDPQGTVEWTWNNKNVTTYNNGYTMTQSADKEYCHLAAWGAIIYIDPIDWNPVYGKYCYKFAVTLDAKSMFGCYHTVETGGCVEECEISNDNWFATVAT